MAWLPQATGSHWREQVLSIRKVVQEDETHSWFWRGGKHQGNFPKRFAQPGQLSDNDQFAGRARDQ